MKGSLIKQKSNNLLLSEDTRDFLEKVPSIQSLYRSRSFDTIQLVQTQIQQYMEEIENITQSNTEKFKLCSEKEKEISIISKAFDQNIDDMTNVNKILQKEIDAFQQKIESQNKCIQKLKLMYQRIVFNHIDLTPYKDLDIEYLEKISDTKNKNFNRIMKNRMLEIRNDERLNYYYIEPFTHHSEYFSTCDDKDKFISKCFELANEKKTQINKPIFDTKDYSQKIKELKERHDAMHSKISSEIVALHKEKDQLINQIEQIRQMKIENQLTKKSKSSTVSPIKSKSPKTSPIKPKGK